MRVPRFIRPRSALVRFRDTMTQLFNWSGSPNVPIVQYLVIRNSLADPLDASGGPQPMGLKQWAAFYNKYIVFGMKVSVEFIIPTGCPSMIFALLWNTNADGIPEPVVTDKLYKASETPDAVMRVSAGAAAANAFIYDHNFSNPNIPANTSISVTPQPARRVRLSGYRSLKRMYPGNTVTDWAQYGDWTTGGYLTDPVRTFQVYIAAQPLPEASSVPINTILVTALVRMRFYAHLSDPAVLTDPGIVDPDEDTNDALQVDKDGNLIYGAPTYDDEQYAENLRV